MGTRAENLLVNDAFSPMYRDTRTVVPVVPDATEVVPGWWILGGNADVVVHPGLGSLTLSGPAGLRLVQPLADTVAQATFAARVVVRAGCVELGATRGAMLTTSILVRPAPVSQLITDQPKSVVDQVVIRFVETATIIVARPSLRKVRSSG